MLRNALCLVALVALTACSTPKPAPNSGAGMWIEVTPAVLQAGPPATFPDDPGPSLR